MTNNRSDMKPAQRRAPSIAIAFRTLGRTLRHGYDNLGTLVMISVLWYIGAILILPLGVVTAALHRVTSPMTEERAVKWPTFFDHLRPDLRWSSLLVIVLILGLYLIQLNISFYAATSATMVQVLAILFTTVLLIWIGTMLFAFPLALRQREQRLTTTLRNAVLMTIANAPGVLVSVILLTILSVVLLVIPPLFILVPGVIALWSEENVRLLLVASGYLEKDEIADRERIKR